MSDTGSERLDQALVARGLVASRSRARDLVQRGLVSVGGRIETRPAAPVKPDVLVTITDPQAAARVSRGAEKLIAALDAFDFEATGRLAVDVGASTGGFTEVLLARGAEKVVAVDVGHGQLHASLAADPRVVSLEGRDARSLTAADIPGPVGAITADVSFISLTLVLPAVVSFAAPGAWLVVLVKPQFEAGRENVGKGGIVRSAAARQAAFDRVEAAIAALPGWRIVGSIPSPITGGSGNTEQLIGARFGERA